ncbi:MAG: recombinase family protein [Chloroflexi bacterium]|nr:recombinase family protein [Chloroflexota bacterium]
MVKHAGIYARISNDPEGDRLGVSRQIADCRAEAERRGWPVADLYVDDDKSAWSGKVRPEYRRLLDDITGHRIDAVLFWHPDRLTRRPIEMEEFIEVCRKAKVEVAWLGGGLASRDDDGLLLLRILGAVASDASAKTSKRIRRKNDERALAGLPTGGGFRPFGYRDDRLTIDPVEAALVREAASRVLAGDALRTIATDWTARGIRSPAGKAWSIYTLHRMLVAARLSGQRAHRGEIVAKATWEAILTPDETAALRTTLDIASHTRSRPTRRYFLTGILRCGRCGASLISRPDALGNRRYVCANGIGQTGCGRLAVKAEPVEGLIADALLLRLDTPEVAAALADASSTDTVTAAEHASLTGDQEQLEELARAYAEKQVTFREWLAARDVIEGRMEATRKRLSRLSRTAAIDPYIGHGGSLGHEWPTLNLNRQRAIATALLDRVTVQPAVPGRATFDPGRIEPLWRI